MLSTDMLSAFAPVGRLGDDNLWAAFGACVLLTKPPVSWMVTARHVMKLVGPRALAVLVNRSSGDGVIVVKVGEILAHYGLTWVEDEVEDLAAAPWPTSPDVGLTTVSLTTCLSMSELVPSMQCFTVGCPYGLHGLNPQKAIPLVLDGVISGVDPANGKVYTSAPTFPGNSGGPLIAIRSQVNRPGSPLVARPTVFLAGIMLETVLLPATDPSSRIPPLHLGVAAPVDAVLALLDSDQAKAITARVEALRPG
jgi:hypothetical protein